MDRYPPYSGRGSYDDRYKGYHGRSRGDIHRSHDGYREPDYRDRDGGRGYPPYMRSPPRRPSDSGRPFRDHSPPPPPMRSRYRSRSPPLPPPSYRSPPPYRERSHYPPPSYHPPYRSSGGPPYSRRPPSSGPIMTSSRPYMGPSGQAMVASPVNDIPPPFRGPSGPPPPPPPLSHHHSRPSSPISYSGTPISSHPRPRAVIAPIQEKEIQRQEDEARKLQVEELTIVGTMRKKAQDLMLAAWEVDKAEHQLELVQRQWEEGNLDNVLDHPRSLIIH